MASKQTNAIEINSAAAGPTIGSGAVAAAKCSCHGHIQLANVVKHVFLILAQGRRRLGLFTVIRTDQKYYKRMWNTDWKRIKEIRYTGTTSFQNFTPFVHRGDFEMWYEALPSAVIVYVLLNIPDRFNSLSNKLVYNNVYRRDISQPWLQRYYARDWELTGDPYKAQGLESLPNKPSVTGIDWQKFGKGPNHSFYGTKL